MRLTALATAFFVFYSGILPAYSADAKAPSTATAVVGFRTNGSDLETQFRTYFQTALAGNGKLTVLADEKVSGQVDGLWRGQEKESEARLAEAYDAYVKGKRLYEQLEVDEAIKSLSQAVRGYREGISALKESRYLLASHLYLGMALVIRGSVEEGKEFIRQMIVLDPVREKHQLPQREFPPKIVSLHRQLTKEILAGASGSLSISTRPNGAQVFFDGVQQLPTPLRIKKVPVGEHFIVAEKKGYGRLWKRIMVEVGENTIDEPLTEWEPLMPYLFARRSDPIANELLTKVGNSLGASVLVLGKFREISGGVPEVSAQLYDVRSREFSKIESMPLDRNKVKKSAEELVKKISNHLTVAGLVVAQIAPEGRVESATSTLPVSQPAPKAGWESPAFYQTWWFWTAVGVVVAGGLGAYFATSGGSPNYHIVTVNNPIAP